MRAAYVPFPPDRAPLARAAAISFARAMLLLALAAAPAFAASAPYVDVVVWQGTIPTDFHARVTACATTPGTLLAVGRHFLGDELLVPVADDLATVDAARTSRGPEGGACGHVATLDVDPSMFYDVTLGAQCFEVTGVLVQDDGQWAQDADHECN